MAGEYQWMERDCVSLAKVKQRDDVWQAVGQLSGVRVRPFEWKANATSFLSLSLSLCLICDVTFIAALLFEWSKRMEIAEEIYQHTESTA